MFTNICTTKFIFDHFLKCHYETSNNTQHKIEISFKVTQSPKSLGLSFIPQPHFQPLNNVICKVMKIKCWNSGFNAQSSKTFVAAVHNCSSSDWLNEGTEEQQKRQGQTPISINFDANLSFKSPFKPSVLFFFISLVVLEISPPLWPGLGVLVLCFHYLADSYL
jgi:hypothetical protein